MLASSMKMDAESAVMPFLGSLRAVMKAMGALPGPEARRAAVVRLADDRARRGDRDRHRGGRRGRVERHHPHVHLRGPGADGVPAAAEPDAVQDRNLLASTVEMVSGMTGGRAVRLAVERRPGVRVAHRRARRLLPARRPRAARGPRRQAAQDLAEGPAARAPSWPATAASSRDRRRQPLARGRRPKALRAALESPTPAIGLDVAGDVLRAARRRAGSRDVRVVVVGDVARGRREGDGRRRALQSRRPAGERDGAVVLDGRRRRRSGVARPRRRAPTCCASRSATPTATSAASSARRRPLEAGRRRRDPRAGVASAPRRRGAPPRWCSGA